MVYSFTEVAARNYENCNLGYGKNQYSVLYLEKTLIDSLIIE